MVPMVPKLYFSLLDNFREVCGTSHLQILVRIVEVIGVTNLEGGGEK